MDIKCKECNGILVDTGFAVENGWCNLKLFRCEDCNKKFVVLFDELSEVIYDKVNKKLRIIE